MVRTWHVRTLSADDQQGFEGECGLLGPGPHGHGLSASAEAPFGKVEAVLRVRHHPHFHVQCEEELAPRQLPPVGAGQVARHAQQGRAVHLHHHGRVRGTGDVVARTRQHRHGCDGRIVPQRHSHALRA